MGSPSRSLGGPADATVSRDAVDRSRDSGGISRERGEALGRLHFRGAAVCVLTRGEGKQCCARASRGLGTFSAMRVRGRAGHAFRACGACASGAGAGAAFSILVIGHNENSYGSNGDLSHLVHSN